MKTFAKPIAQNEEIIPFWWNPKGMKMTVEKFSPKKHSD